MPGNLQPNRKNNLIETWLEEHYVSLLSILSRWFPSKYLPEIEPGDILQDTFVELLKKDYAELSKKEKPFPYLYAIAKHIIVDKVKKNKKIGEALVEKHRNPASSYNKGIDWLKEEDLLNLLNQNLSDVMFEIIYLAILGLSYSEIADEIGKTQEAVRKTMERARKRLKDKI